MVPGTGGYAYECGVWFFVHRSRAIFGRAVPDLHVTIRNVCIAVGGVLGRAGRLAVVGGPRGRRHAATTRGDRVGRLEAAVQACTSGGSCSSRRWFPRRCPRRCRARARPSCRPRKVRVPLLRRSRQSRGQKSGRLQTLAWRRRRRMRRANSDFALQQLAEHLRERGLLDHVVDFPSALRAAPPVWKSIAELMFQFK